MKLSDSCTIPLPEVPKVIGQQLLIAENMKPERQQVIHRQSLNSNSTKSSLLAKALA